MHRARLSHFLAVSLAVHASALLVNPGAPPARQWLAGPVILRIAPLPERTRGKLQGPNEQPADAAGTRRAAAKHTTVAAATAPPPAARGITSIPVTAAESLPETVPVAGSARPPAAEIPDQPAALEQQLLDSLQAALIPHFRYPLLARRRGWEGIVRIGVRIEANGSLTRLHLVEPSPYDVLNTAAIDSLTQLARLPNAGGWLHGRSVDLVLPVEYRLLEG